MQRAQTRAEKPRAVAHPTDAALGWNWAVAQQHSQTIWIIWPHTTLSSLTLKWKATESTSEMLSERCNERRWYETKTLTSWGVRWRQQDDNIFPLTHYEPRRRQTFHVWFPFLSNSFLLINNGPGVTLCVYCNLSEWHDLNVTDPKHE